VSVMISVGFSFRLLFQHDGEQDQAITKRAGDHDAVQAG
jgi:hypothetical protein